MELAQEDKDLLPPVVELTGEELWAVFDAHALHYLGMSGEEFLRRWDAGEFDNSESTAVLRLEMLEPFVRK